MSAKSLELLTLAREERERQNTNFRDCVRLEEKLMQALQKLPTIACCGAQQTAPLQVKSANLSTALMIDRPPLTTQKSYNPALGLWAWDLS
ncbi:hypothetical protein PR048_032706 [Dryococelus australis]|uniref:Uncharacterized protein n=1 Tax=Dryococelus australis TaxID=614101 RepID=A0ABQ9G2Y5_9NEOP|nr:hypothetical protein PR048_032706 [Dryococelus australis]